jgi:folate-binding protein YgfZ
MMSMSNAALLEDRAILAASGTEARGFLNGLITNDIEKVSPANAIYAALLTPQGKILFDFLIVEGDGALLIDCAAVSRDALAKRLTMYRLRAKVTIEPRDQLAVLVGLTGRPALRGITFDDPRHPGLGTRSIGARAEMPNDVGTSADYHKHRLELGVPEASDFGSDKMFALDGNLDELHAVSFEKGCYVGQELTARMKHRGTARKRLMPVYADTALPRSGTLKAGSRDIGEIATAYGKRGFASIRLDRLEEIGAGVVETDGLRINIIRPAWLFP